mmetsp:Transcript_440/g.1408  ORF Transcript_440/g.1408 Transcript_440/m.1408 type:complete len:434 (+) Transcript_440:6123-7424(+)
MPRDVDGFARARRTRHHDVLVLEDQRVEQVRVADGIRRRNDELRERRGRVVFVGRHGLHPLDPLALLRVVQVVEDEAGLGQLVLGGVHPHEMPDPDVHLLSPVDVHGATHAPNKREDEDGLHLVADPLDVLGRLGLVAFPVVVRRELAVHEIEQRIQQRTVDGRKGLREVLPHDAARGREVRVEERQQRNFVARSETLREALQPRLEYGVEPQRPRLHVDHAAPRDGRGRRDGQVLGLEHHRHRVRQRHDFARRQTELLVVVEHGVHVLDPDRVDGAVQQHPLSVFGLADLGRRGVSIINRQHAVGPLVRDFVEAAVQLPHRDALWVHHERHDVRPPAVLRILRVELAERRGEHLPGGRLARKRHADDHEAVPDDHHVVDLHDFAPEVVRGLQIPFRAGVGKILLHRVSIGFRELHAREQVGRDAVEERHVRR